MRERGQSRHSANVLLEEVGGEDGGDEGDGGHLDVDGAVAAVLLALADVGVVLLEHGLVAVLLVLLVAAGADDAGVTADWKRRENLKMVFSLSFLSHDCAME